MKTSNYRLRADLHAKVVNQAKAMGIKPTHLLQRIVEDYFYNFKEEDR